MTIEKAIEIQKRYLTHPYIKGEHELKDSLQLGIEALKRIKLNRPITSYHVVDWLPGETEED